MRSVLIVDDEKILLDATRSFLERFGGMKVQTAISTKEALSILASETFDALVVDYYLPEITGIELLKIIRAKGDTTPVIIFTGVGRENAAIEALNNGADFFLKKGDNPSSEFRELTHMINRAVERRHVGRSLGISEKVLSGTVSFFPEAAFAIDREGKVLAWNLGMADLTGISDADIIGKGEGAYSVPFFGRKAPMLVDLIFEKDETIRSHRYTIINKEQATIFAWIKITRADGTPGVLWMKATALYDAKGAFIAALSMVRDITNELGEELLRQADYVSDATGPVSGHSVTQGNMFNKFLGKAKSAHKEGLRLSFREGKYREAIPLFTQAIEIDPQFAYAWHDRGVALREIGQDEEAAKDFEKASELAPTDEEILFSRADLLRKRGILREQKSLIDAAVRAFNKVLEMNPNNAEAWNGLAICMKELEKDETARQYFDRSNELGKTGKARFKKRNLDSLI
ncbi:response regulator [Methanoregula sp.]|jgi:Flp pilus assembly protein TadD/CheY-like chemotaxis protein|uniref:response regulator n=1 Tax=Methanoregula sp. TaxID=2052170 RepID=UPI003C157ED3